MRDAYNWNYTVFERLLESVTYNEGMMVHPTLLRPKSVGSMVLSGPSINNPPVIDPNYLDHPEDLPVLIEGLKVLKRMEKTKAFRKHDIHVVGDNLLCGGIYEPFSDAYLECYARDKSHSNKQCHSSNLALEPLQMGK